MESLRLVFSIDLLSYAIGSPYLGVLPELGVDPPHLGVSNPVIDPPHLGASP